MYHFVADNNAEPLRFSNRLEVSGQICQYLKPFQLEALRFLYTHYEKRDSSILNDESGLGKCATICVFLGAVLESGKDKCLVVVQTDEDIIGWQFHLNVLSRHLTFQVITQDSDCTSLAQNLFIAKWNTLNSIGDLNRLDFNHIIVDNRGQILNNNFCLAMLLKYYEKKVDIFISSIDITSDLKLFYNALRLCGRLEHQYSSWKSFEAKFKLPNAKEVSGKNVSLEEYFLKREILIDYCKNFRLRRFRHQQEDCLPLVDLTRYKNNLDSWRTEYHSKTDSSTKNSEAIQEVFNISAEKNTEELFEHYIQLKKEKVLSEEIIDITNTSKRLEDDACVEVIDTPVIMSPLLFVSESDDESEGEAQCTDSIIEVISVEDSDEKLQTDADGKGTKKKTTTSSNKSDLNKIIQTKRNLRKSDNPKKIILNDSNMKVTRNNENISGKVLRNHSIKVVEESKEKRNKTKQKDSNQEKTHTTAQTRNGGEISENIDRIEIKIVNKRKTRSTIIAMPVKKDNISKNGNKADDSSNPSPKRNLRGSRNEVSERIKLRTKDHSNNLQRTSKKNESDKVPMKQEKYTKEIIDKSSNLSKNSDEAPKRRSNMLVTKEKTEIQFPEVISKGFNLKNDTVKKVTKASTKSNEETAKEKVNCAKNTKNDIIDTKAKVNNENTSSNREIKKKLSGEILSVPKQEVKSPQKSSTNKKTPEKEVATVKNNYSKNSSKDLITVINDKHITPKTSILKSVTPRKVCTTSSLLGQHELAIAPVGLRTRGMKRATRSSGGSVKSKYMLADWSLDIDKKLGLLTKKVRKKSINKVVTEVIEPMNGKKNTNKKMEENNKSSSRSVQSMTQSNNIVEATLKNNPANKSSQTSFLPMSDYEDIQCGQKLTPNSNASFEQQPQIFRKSYDFLVPSTPPSLRNLEYPSFPLSSLNIPDSELAIVPSTSTSANTDVILLSSSQDECSISSVSSLSRRTRVLKRKEIRNQPVIQNKSMGNKLKAPFAELLFQQNLRKSEKSPDIFSNCSDVGLTCSQANNKAFEGFKIFGSEVKQFQQQYARSATATGHSSKDRSCLDLLEKMFEPRQKKATPKKTAQKVTRQNKRADIVPALPVESTTTKSTQLATERVNSKTLTNKSNPIEEDVVFEITNNGTFGSMIRINSNGDASPVQQQLLKSTQHNKITNYLIGSAQQAAVISLPGESDLQLQRTPRKNTQLSGTANGINGNGSGNWSSVQRKSPKSKQTTQNTKLTKWFSKNSAGKPLANESTNEMHDNNSTRKSPLKRRRLELSFNK